MVRVLRSELPASCTQTTRSTNWATPGYLILFSYGSGMGQGRLTHIVTHTILTSFSTFSRGKIEKCDLFKEIKNETVAYSVLPKQARYTLIWNCGTARAVSPNLCLNLQAALLGSFQCSCGSFLELFRPVRFRRRFRLLGFVWDEILYIVLPTGFTSNCGCFAAESSSEIAPHKQRNKRDDKNAAGWLGW